MRWTEVFRRQSGAVRWDVDDGQYGLCDRLRGLGCGLAWAAALGRRLHYGWRPNEPCPAEFGSLFESPRAASIAAHLPPPADGDLFLRLPANPLPHQFWRHLMEAGLSCGPFRSLGEFRKSWAAHLRQLKPVRSVRQAVAGMQTRLRGRALVGIHLRRTDVVGSAAKPEITAANVGAHDSALLAHVRSVFTAQRDVCFYLASDCRETFSRWSGALRSEEIPFLFHEKEWSEKFRQTAVSDALCDLWMLGSCAEVLGTVESGFLVIASALGAQSTLLKLPEPRRS